VKSIYKTRIIFTCKKPHPKATELWAIHDNIVMLQLSWRQLWDQLVTSAKNKLTSAQDTLLKYLLKQYK